MFVGYFCAASTLEVQSNQVACWIDICTGETAMRGISCKPLLGAIFAVAIFLPATVSALPFTDVFIFGDSLTDTGNNALVLDNEFAPPLSLPPGALRTSTPISGPDFIPDYPYASGRYSNGPVWAEYFAANLGLNATASLMGGTNMAFGGARSGPVGSPFPFSLLDQVSMFLAGVGGIAPASALYVVQGGGNDARDAFATAAIGGDPTSIISGYALNIMSIITSLDGAGAQEFLLWNIPDIGKTPAIQSLGPVAAGLASSLAMSMNDAVDALLGTLPAGVTDGLHRFDAFGLVNQIFSDPTAFGLTDATTACAVNPVCISNPSSTFFWDGIHPTTAGHAIFAQAALAAIPEPGTVLLIGVGLVVITWRRRAPA